jgi:hypothetical protein
VREPLLNGKERSCRPLSILDQMRLIIKNCLNFLQIRPAIMNEVNFIEPSTLWDIRLVGN